MKLVVVVVVVEVVVYFKYLKQINTFLIIFMLNVSFIGYLHKIGNVYANFLILTLANVRVFAFFYFTAKI